MKKIWMRFAQVLSRKENILLTAVLILGAFGSTPVLGGMIKIKIENRSFNTDRIDSPHIFFTNQAGPEPTSLFLIPAQGQTIEKTMEESALLSIFRNPNTWKAYMRGVPFNSLTQHPTTLHECTFNKIHLNGHQLNELKMTISDHACDVVLTMGAKHAWQG